MRTVVAIALVGIFAGACGPTCQNTCRRVYAQNECGITDPALNEEELIRECEADCETALLTTGEVGDYDPNVRTPTDKKIILENEMQAAAWMDCVWETECEDLHPANGGYCAPI